VISLPFESLSRRQRGVSKEGGSPSSPTLSALRSLGRRLQAIEHLELTSLDDQGPEKTLMSHARRTGVVKGPLERCLTIIVRRVL